MPTPIELNQRATAALYAGMPGVAVRLYQEALEQTPQDADVLYNLANALYADGRTSEALRYYKQSLALQPEDTAARYNLASVLEQNGHRLRAAWHYHKLTTLDPACHAARYRRNILLGRTPEAAPLDYVERLFNGYAPSFDQSLAENLRYQGAQTLAKLIVEEALPRSGGFARTLDIGCGTGIFGTLIHNHTTFLAGVDIAEAMLEKAAERGLYGQLHHREMVAFLREHTERYDLVCAADCLPYTGNLAPLFAALPLVLAPGGMVAFTVEQARPWQALRRGYRVTFPGRFRHARHYVQRLATINRLRLLTHRTAPLRQEKGRWLRGGYYLLQAVAA